MRPIDADAIPWVDLNADNPNSKVKILVAFADKINKMTTIEERKMGKWIKNSNGTYSCDKCHSWIPNEQHYYANFCLYCGADMRGEEK